MREKVPVHHAECERVRRAVREPGDGEATGVDRVATEDVAQGAVDEEHVRSEPAAGRVPCFVARVGRDDDETEIVGEVAQAMGDPLARAVRAVKEKEERIRGAGLPRDVERAVARCAEAEAALADVRNLRRCRADTRGEASRQCRGRRFARAGGQ